MVINKDITSAVFFILLSAGLLFLLPFQIDESEAQGLTARTLPRFTLILMLFFSIAYFIKSLVEHRRKEDKESKLMISWAKELKVLGLFIIIGIYVWALPYMGYLIASSVMSIGLLLYLRVHQKAYYVAAIVLVFVIYYAFTLLLSIQLP